MKKSLSCRFCKVKIRSLSSVWTEGLCFLHDHDIKPDYIVGDFDSAPDDVVTYYREETNVPIREFNPVKDASDTEIALRAVP